MTISPLAPPWLQHPQDANALDAAVWPGNAVRAASGVVELAGVSVVELAGEYGTPLYIMDEADVRSRALGARSSFEGEFARVGSAAKVYYAGKAFLSTEIARWVTDAGLGIDVCSGGELAVALAAGVDPNRLGFHGNNKSEAEIDRAVGVGVGVIVLDSTIEVERVASAAQRHGRRQPVRLRVNTGVHAHTHEYLATAWEDQKFGIALGDAPAAVAAIRSHPSLEFLGLHGHIGSQIFGADGFAESASRLLEVHAGLLAGGPVPELNLGGGFGIAYTSVDDAMPLADIARALADIVAAECSRLGIPIPVVAVEPGRSIVGPSTVTLYEVGTVKNVEVSTRSEESERTTGVPFDASRRSQSDLLSTGTLADARSSGNDTVPEEARQGRLEGLEGGNTSTRKYVSVDGGMSDNIRPALYAADYSVRIASRTSAADAALVRIVGKHCESGDIVVHADYLPGDVRPGDLVAVPATGAYCWSMASNYNYLGRPAVVAVQGGRSRVIVRGETEADLLSRDAGIHTANTPAGAKNGNA